MSKWEIIFNMSHKAKSLEEINQAVKFDEAISPDHDFFTDFSAVRGDFEEEQVYRNLNIEIKDGKPYFDFENNSDSKVKYFLGGMRGSGKTTELQRYAKKLNSPQAFFCVVCNIDEELDLNNLEYMDILIFQLEKLSELLDQHGFSAKESNKAIDDMYSWFSQTVNEVNKKLEGTAELNIEAKAGIGFAKIASLFSSLKLGMKGSVSRANSVRTVLKNRFDEFALHFNTYLQKVNNTIRKHGLGNEVLFIIDGLEKTMTADTRRRIILEETNRIRQIEAYTLFTLPIELMKERQKLDSYFFIDSFPFVKILEKDGTIRDSAVEKFKKFVFKRIRKSLFESEKVVEKAIYYCGGSPRELLKILKSANLHADRQKGKIDMEAMDKGLKRLANQTAQYIEPEEWKKIQEVVQLNSKNGVVFFDSTVQQLLEKLLLMEYNDGTYKRPNPILELSDAYQSIVPGADYSDPDLWG